MEIPKLTVTHGRLTRPDSSVDEEEKKARELRPIRSGEEEAHLYVTKRLGRLSVSIGGKRVTNVLQLEGSLRYYPPVSDEKPGAPITSAETESVATHFGRVPDRDAHKRPVDMKTARLVMKLIHDPHYQRDHNIIT